MDGADYEEAFQYILQTLSRDEGSVDAFAAAHARFLAQLEEMLLPPIAGKRPAELYGGAQSKQFMIQLLPTFQRYMRGFPERKTFELLDVGPGTAIGSNLLGSLYRTAVLGYKAVVHTTDIVPHFLRFAKVFCPHVQAHQQDIFAIQRSYDIVIASHVIEHVPDWRAFVQQLRKLSRGIVVVCAPYKEDPSRLTNGHINIFDDAAIETMEAERIELTESPAWGQFMEPPYRMFIATLKGTATVQPAPIAAD